MPEKEKKDAEAVDRASDSSKKSPFSATEALLASIAVILLLVIILYSFFHADRQADPVVVYLAESSGFAASAAGAASIGDQATPGVNLAVSAGGESSSVPASSGEESTASASEAAEEIPMVNINTASVSELTALPGIGEVKAEAIIAYREEFGEFLSVSQLLNVSGIGEKTLEKIRDYIVLS